MVMRLNGYDTLGHCRDPDIYPIRKYNTMTYFVMMVGYVKRCSRGNFHREFILQVTILCSSKCLEKTPTSMGISRPSMQYER